MERLRSIKTENLIIAAALTGIPLLNQMNTSIRSIGNMIYIPMLLVLFYAFYFQRVLVFDEQSRVILMLFYAATVVLPILDLNIIRAGISETVMEMGLSAVTFTAVFLLANENHGMPADSMIGYMLLGNSVVLFYNILLNADEISLMNISYLLQGERSVRAYFGFSHPNTVALYACLEVILLYLYLIRIRRRYIIGAALIVLSWAAIVSTGSRTGFYCASFFIGMEVYQNYLMRKVRTKLKNLIYLIPVFLVFTLLTSSTYTLDMTSYTSGRDVLNAECIAQLQENGWAFFGYAPLNLLSLSPYLDLTDCGYVITIAQFGYVGLGIFIIIFCYMAWNFFQREAYTGMNLLMVLVLYSATENVVFNSGVSLSVCLWILMALYLVRDEEMKKLTTQTETI
ncbi:MAG: hypothetical protein LIO86_10715 [Lachnospiraceae bacterium]|nr:hypothetical protein [Lachnospiraceae bacterium]